jgi:anti-sigma B factor antagonist
MTLDDLPSACRPFSLSITREGERAHIALDGELDLLSEDEIDQAVREVRRSGATRVVLDLRGVTFIDSAGLRVLLALRNDAHRNRHSLTLLAPEAPVRRIFDITGTRGLFEWDSPASGDARHDGAGG